MLIQVRKTYKWPLGSLYGGVVEEAMVAHNSLRTWFQPVCLYYAYWNITIILKKL